MWIWTPQDWVRLSTTWNSDRFQDKQSSYRWSLLSINQYSLLTIYLPEPSSHPNQKYSWTLYHDFVYLPFLFALLRGPFPFHHIRDFNQKKLATEQFKPRHSRSKWCNASCQRPASPRHPISVVAVTFVRSSTETSSKQAKASIHRVPQGEISFNKNFEKGVVEISTLLWALSCQILDVEYNTILGLWVPPRNKLAVANSLGESRNLSSKTPHFVQINVSKSLLATTHSMQIRWYKKTQQKNKQNQIMLKTKFKRTSPACADNSIVYTNIWLQRLVMHCCQARNGFLPICSRQSFSRINLHLTFTLMDQTMKDEVVDPHFFPRASRSEQRE